MAKNNEQGPDEGEQLELIDITPEYAKPILAAGRKYKKALAARQAALAEEIEAKHKIIELVKQAKIAPNAEGITQCRVDGMTIKITPRDELVRVKLDEDDEGGDDE